MKNYLVTVSIKGRGPVYYFCDTKAEARSFAAYYNRKRKLGIYSAKTEKLH